MDNFIGLQVDIVIIYRNTTVMTLGKRESWESYVDIKAELDRIRKLVSQA